AGAEAGVGPRGRAEPPAPAGGVVVGDVSGARDLLRRLALQPAGRRPAGRRRSAAAPLALMGASDARDDRLLAVEGLRITIAADDGPAYVLDHVDLTIPRGRIVGVVGESGCGKSTLARAVLGILPRQARIESGRITLDV